MARIRTIKPEFPQSESMGRISRDARLLFVMLWTICDDSGRARANSRMLASLLFPYDNDAIDLMERWLIELEGEKCIVRYENDADRYIAIAKWTDHQKIDKPSKSRFPEPPSFAKKPRKVAKPREASGLDQGREGTKDQGPSFDDFWKVCSKKVGKGKAEQLFESVTKSGADPKLLVDAMSRYAASVSGKDPTFTAHPATWLNQKRWLDEDGTGPPSLRVVVSDEVRAQEEENLRKMGVI